MLNTFMNILFRDTYNRARMSSITQRLEYAVYDETESHPKGILYIDVPSAPAVQPSSVGRTRLQSFYQLMVAADRHCPLYWE